MSERQRYRSIFRPALFEGQLHIVTGGGSGIGRCTAHELASLGAIVVVIGRNEAKLDEVVAEIEHDGGKVGGARRRRHTRRGRCKASC
ncbi:MAG: SDR family NAD(P)-dependent oxidoreductase [Rhodomicrobium sp.]